MLDDPVISTVPDTLRRLQDEAVPLLVELRETQSRVSVVATFAEEATARLANLPGASLLRQRRRPLADPVDPVDPASPSSSQPSPPADPAASPDEDDQPE